MYPNIISDIAYDSMKYVLDNEKYENETTLVFVDLIGEEITKRLCKVSKDYYYNIFILILPSKTQAWISNSNISHLNTDFHINCQYTNNEFIANAYVSVLVPSKALKNHIEKFLDYSEKINLFINNLIKNYFNERNVFDETLSSKYIKWLDCSIMNVLLPALPDFRFSLNIYLHSTKARSVSNSYMYLNTQFDGHLTFKYLNSGYYIIVEKLAISDK